MILHIGTKNQGQSSGLDVEHDSIYRCVVTSNEQKKKHGKRTRTYREDEEHLLELPSGASPTRLHRRGRPREVQEHHPAVAVAVVPDAPGEAPRRAARGEDVGVEDPVREAGGPRGADEADGDDAVAGGGRAGAGAGGRRGGGGRGGWRRSA